MGEYSSGFHHSAFCSGELGKDIILDLNKLSYIWNSELQKTHYYQKLGYRSFGQNWFHRFKAIT